MAQAMDGVAEMEKINGKKFGDLKNPANHFRLLYSKYPYLSFTILVKLYKNVSIYNFIFLAAHKNIPQTGPSCPLGKLHCLHWSYFKPFWKIEISQVPGRHTGPAYSGRSFGGTMSGNLLWPHRCQRRRKIHLFKTPLRCFGNHQRGYCDLPRLLPAAPWLWYCSPDSSSGSSGVLCQCPGRCSPPMPANQSRRPPAREPWKKLSWMRSNPPAENIHILISGRNARSATKFSLSKIWPKPLMAWHIGYLCADLI